MNTVIDQQLSNADFGVSELCAALDTGQSQLYRKIKKLTGQSTAVYLRNYRLHRSLELLQNEELKIAEVAFAVGFKESSYYTRSFSELYGETPTAYRIRINT